MYGSSNHNTRCCNQALTDRSIIPYIQLLLKKTIIARSSWWKSSMSAVSDLSPLPWNLLWQRIITTLQNHGRKRNPSVKKTFLTHIHTQHRNYSKMAQTWQQKENDGGKVMPQKSVKHHGNGGTHLQTDARHTAWRASNAKARSEGELSASSQWDKGIVSLVEPNIVNRKVNHRRV